MMAMNKSFIPEKARLWAMLNASHIGLDKILDEFLDNSVSARAKNIVVRLEQMGVNRFRLTVEDDGDGIAEEKLNRAFGVGHIPADGEKGVYNQYGIGLKSALASCDRRNQKWELFTRTAGHPSEYLWMKAPYREERIDYAVCRGDQEPWPGRLAGEKGTMISVPINRTMLKSLSPNRLKTDEERIQLLAEELAVTYTPLLEEAGLRMTLYWKPLTGDEKMYSIDPIHPVWTRKVLEGKDEDLNLGSGPLKVNYTMGIVEEHPDTQKYYQCNITSSGLMIFLDGRLIQANLFRQIWRQPHPSYNPFLIQVDLRTDGSREALPIPTPDKARMVLSDPRCEALLAWVRKLCPDPKEYIPKRESEEAVKCRMLEELLHSSGAASVTHLELPLEIGSRNAVRTDIYARFSDGRAVLYEAKAHYSKILDVAQLAVYYLIAATSGLALNEAVLVAEKHPDWIRMFLDILIKHWFRGLPVPKLRLLTWDEVENGTY